MSKYVLVHGAWHGSWCWKRVRTALQAAGHDVFTPTLTGVGERSHLNAPTVDLSTHIADIANLLRWEELGDVVLVGHSYGGCVIRGVANQMPERLRALVYLDAFVLDDGECLYDVLPPGQAEHGRETAIDGWQVRPIPAEVFQVNEQDLAWVNAQCTVQSRACFEEKLRLTGTGSRASDVTHIRATGFREGSPFAMHHERARAKGWKLREILAGHDVMLDAPDELVRLLLEFA